MLLKLKRFDTWLHSHCSLLLILCLLIVLRIPNFFEPYWYGDEGIYLTLGNAMRHGERLYLEIIDHKTPLIYYLAMVPTQFAFRVLLLGWMLVATTAFYCIAHRLISHRWAVWTATVVFTLLTTLPLMEGNIPNGELFVMGFILVGGLILTRTQLWHSLFKKTDETKIKTQYPDWVLLLSAGVFFSLGILTKVPALFDFFGFASLAWFSLSRMIFKNPLSIKNLKLSLSHVLPSTAVLLVGVVLPILVSILYFVLRGSGQAYLDYGLLYNFRYVESWKLPFDNDILLFLFTLPGKVWITGSIILVLTFLGKWVRPTFQFVAAWLCLTLFASLLSNRPYPHYLLQMVPALAMMVGLVLENLLALFSAARTKKMVLLLELGLSLGIAIFVWQPIQLLEFGKYPTVSYYQRWVKLATGQMSLIEYNNSFDRLMSDNYHAAQILSQSPDPYLFIWGTNPTLYALSQKVPTGRFTVAFHIRDFDAYNESLASVKAKKPEYIIIMKDEAHSFPEFNEYIDENYMPNANFTHFTLWKLL